MEKESSKKQCIAFKGCAGVPLDAEASSQMGGFPASGGGSMSRGSTCLSVSVITCSEVR